MRKFIAVILAVVLCAQYSVGVFAIALSMEKTVKLAGGTQELKWEINNNGYYEVHIKNNSSEKIELWFYRDCVEEENAMFGHEVNANSVLSFTAGNTGNLDKGTYYIKITPMGTQPLNGKIYYKLASSYDALSLTPPKEFSQVEELPSEELEKIGILRGDPDGNLRLGDTITRAEAAAFLVRMELGNTDNKTYISAPFEDIAEHWAEKEVSLAYSLKLVEGTSETTFEPDKKVTAQEFVKMLISLLGYSEVAESRGGYPVGYLSHANQLGVFNGANLITTAEALRSDIVTMIVNCLDIPIMQMSSVSFGGGDITYTIADGKEGRDYITLRTKINKKMGIVN